MKLKKDVKLPIIQESEKKNNQTLFDDTFDLQNVGDDKKKVPFVVEKQQKSSSVDLVLTFTVHEKWPHRVKRGGGKTRLGSRETAAA